MKAFISNIKFQISHKIFVKDPETSELGKKILKESIILIDEIGFEEFTFKKLGTRINSNESSIYRYFENKHKLLVYLSCWYWSWIEYKLIIATSNIDDNLLKLNKAIKVVTEAAEDDIHTEYINESLLNKIIIEDFTKTIHTKEVDNENKEGFFIIYKRVINRLIEIINSIKPEYPYAKSLASNIVEGALHQHFLKNHLKTITDCNENTSPSDFYIHLVKQLLK